MIHMVFNLVRNWLGSGLWWAGNVRKVEYSALAIDLFSREVVVPESSVGRMFLRSGT